MTWWAGAARPYHHSAVPPAADAAAPVPPSAAAAAATAAATATAAAAAAAAAATADAVAAVAVVPAVAARAPAPAGTGAQALVQHELQLVAAPHLHVIHCALRQFSGEREAPSHSSLMLCGIPGTL